MGYTPKPWPGVANRHRLRAMLDAAEIKKMAIAACKSVYANPDLAISHMQHIATLAQVVVDTLEAAPGPVEPVEEEGEDGCQ
jgi:hypothetical protein